MDKRETKADTARVPDSGTGLLIFGTIADTTWRMFVPVFLLLGIGMWLDHITKHKPLFTILGVIGGFGVAVLLVWQQYRQSKTPEEGERK